MKCNIPFTVWPTGKQTHIWKKKRKTETTRQQTWTSFNIYRDCRLFLALKDHLYIKLDIMKDLSKEHCIITNKNDLRIDQKRSSVWGSDIQHLLHCTKGTLARPNTAWCLDISILISLHSEWLKCMREWVEAGKNQHHFPLPWDPALNFTTLNLLQVIFQIFKKGPASKKLFKNHSVLPLILLKKYSL